MKTKTNLLSCASLVLIVNVLLAQLAHAQQPEPPKGPESERWERAIQAFEARDRKTPPAPGSIVLTGSSSARGWNVKLWFEDLAVINRGFGGSVVADANHYFDRIVTPYEPSAIVLYSGDNDVARGLNTESIIDDYKIFLAKAKQATPKAQVILLAVKPSLARWNLWPDMQAVNRELERLAMTDPKIEFLDVSQVMLTETGEPDPSIFVADGLHMNQEGYRRWTELIQPLLGLLEAE